MSLPVSRGVRFRALLGALHEMVVPAVCLGCGSLGAGPLALCVRCSGRLKRLRPARCATCGLPLARDNDSGGGRCGACLARPRAIDRLLAAWSYEPPLDAVLHALKFGRLEVLGGRLAAAMLDPLRHQALAGYRAQEPELPEADLVVPVPLHWRRQILRGYNQAERIARPLARALEIPFSAALKRRRATVAQARLGRGQRPGNLRHAFRARRPLQGLSVVLVDDVATTGATLEAAASALRRSGATRIVAVVAALTPEPGAVPPEDRAPDRALITMGPAAPAVHAHRQAPSGQERLGF